MKGQKNGGLLDRGRLLGGGRRFSPVSTLPVSIANEDNSNKCKRGERLTFLSKWKSMEFYCVSRNRENLPAHPLASRSFLSTFVLSLSLSLSLSLVLSYIRLEAQFRCENDRNSITVLRLNNFSLLDSIRTMALVFMAMVYILTILYGCPLWNVQRNYLYKLFVIEKLSYFVSRRTSFLDGHAFESHTFDETMYNIFFFCQWARSLFYDELIDLHIYFKVIQKVECQSQYSGNKLSFEFHFLNFAAKLREHLQSNHNFNPFYFSSQSRWKYIHRDIKLSDSIIKICMY